jgi:hypothetical protein
MEKPIGKYLRARRPISAPLTIAIISPEYVCMCACVRARAYVAFLKIL